MATADERTRRFGAVWELLDRYGLDRAHVAVFHVVVLALAVRLYALGDRVAHWDEGRVAYWIVDFATTGNFEYRPIIHGPFYHHVNAVLFDLFGASDVTMRLVVAVAGGLFPFVALLFRDRLRDVEVVALAVFLAINPALLYYSRFMRGDPLVAIFMFTAFALFVRTVDTGRVRYVHAGVAFTALGFTVKENALLYLVIWVGATALLLDHRLFLAGDGDSGDLATDYLRRAGDLLRRHVGTVLLAAVEFLVVIVYFYAPRAQSEAGPGLRKAVEDPDLLPAVLEAATIGAWQDLWGLWVAGDHQDHAYLPYLADYLLTMGTGGFAVAVLAVVGFLADRYRDGGPSDLVSFAFYWGFVSVLGYPIVTDIQAPWATIHAIVPLAVPAAVGVGHLLRRASGALADGDAVRAGVTALVVVLALGQVVGASASAVYLNPTGEDNELVQYAQPADDFEPVMDRLAAAAPQHSGPDVVLYSDYFVESANGSAPREPGCSKWFNALPLPWYFSAADAEATCAESARGLGDVVEESRPPVVIARSDDASTVADELPGYEYRTHRLRAWGTETAFFVREDYADELPASDDELPPPDGGPPDSRSGQSARAVSGNPGG